MTCGQVTVVPDRGYKLVHCSHHGVIKSMVSHSYGMEIAMDHLVENGGSTDDVVVQ